MDEGTLQLTRCPGCGGHAEIERRTVLESTDGPIEHLRLRCVRRHWFVVPAAMLETDRRSAPRRRTAGDRR